MGLLVLGLLISQIVIWINAYEERLWRGNNLVAIMIRKDDEFCLVGIQPGKKLIAVKIDPETLVPLVGGYGKYRLKAVNGLADQESWGSKLLEQSLEKWLGVVMLGQIEARTGDCQSKLGVVTAVGLGNSEGINFWDKVKLVTNIWGINHIQANFQNFGEEKMTIQENIGKELRTDVLDQTRTWFSDDLLTEDPVSVAVVNLTSRPGLADEASEMLKAIGYDVVRNSWEPKETKTILRIDKQLESQIGKIFPLLETLPFEHRFEEDLSLLERAMIKLELGEDFAQWARGK